MNNKNSGPNWHREEPRQEYRQEYRERFIRRKIIIKDGQQVHSQGGVQGATLFSYGEQSSWEVHSDEVFVALDCGCCINNDSDARPKVINYEGRELIICERCLVISLCSLCGGFIGVDPKNRVWINKRVYCKLCSEELLVELLNHAKEYPGSIDHLELSRFKSQLALIRSERSWFWRLVYGISIKEVKRIDEPEKY